MTWTYPEWQKPYHEALTELNPAMLRERVLAAEAAIFRREQALAHQPDADRERTAIRDALRALTTLRLPAGI